MESKDKEECYIFEDRNDRLGSNFMLQIGLFILSKKENKKILKKKKAYKYQNSIFFLPIHHYMDLCISENPTILETYTGMRGPCADFMIKHKQDVISYFNDNFKEKFFHIIKKNAIEKKLSLPWKNNDDSICFHLRSEDCIRANDCNGTVGFNQYIKWIENGSFKNSYKKASGDNQCPINPGLFEKKITELMTKYPDKQIYIITYGCIPKIHKKIIDDFNLKIISNQREEHDCWLMANCHTLVITKSTFPLPSALCFQGKEIHYQVWPRWACLGLGTKYDKSGWIGFY